MACLNCCVCVSCFMVEMLELQMHAVSVLEEFQLYDYNELKYLCKCSFFYGMMARDHRKSCSLQAQNMDFY